MAVFRAAIQQSFDTGEPVTKNLSDRTEIVTCILPEVFLLQVSGTHDVIIEIGEQVAWLASSLRCSPKCHDSTGVTYCSPAAMFLRNDDQASTIICINFDTNPDKQTLPLINGACWRIMFRNPVVVMGYPIRKRSREDTGLEIPLNMMAGLIGCTRLNEFLRKFYIKGFSSMLVAVERVDGVYIWHHLYQADGRHISYLDPDDDKTIKDVFTHDLATARHIVGWCNNVDIRTGKQDMNYHIRRSGLPLGGREFALEKISFSCGQILTGGCTFGIGRKDVPIHVSKASYIDKLRWISQKYVVLWDEDDKRGWMVNGSGALLHLLRGSREHARTDKFNSQFLFDMTKFKDTTEYYKHDSAIEVLLNTEYRRLPVYPAKEETSAETTVTLEGVTTKATKIKTTYKTLEDKVEDLFECLEKIIEHKSQIENPKGLNVKLRLRRHLEGWDFRDLTTNRDPFHLRVKTLPPSTYSWVELTRAVPVVTLFGRGFGDLFAPSPVSSNRMACATWRSVPKNQHYLCISVADLQETINDFGGSMSPNLIHVTSSLVWRNPARTSPFGPCICEKIHTKSTQDTPNPVQQMVSSSLPTRFLTSKGAIDLDGCDNGAVIFGQAASPGFHWIWPDSGDMKREKNAQAVSADNTSEGSTTLAGGNNQSGDSLSSTAWTNMSISSSTPRTPLSSQATSSNTGISSPPTLATPMTMSLRSLHLAEKPGESSNTRTTSPSGSSNIKSPASSSSASPGIPMIQIPLKNEEPSSVDLSSVPKYTQGEGSYNAEEVGSRSLKRSRILSEEDSDNSNWGSKRHQMREGFRSIFRSSQGKE